MLPFLKSTCVCFCAPTKMTQAVLQSIFFYSTLTNVLKIFYKESVRRTCGAMCVAVLGASIDFIARQKLVV